MFFQVGGLYANQVAKVDFFRTNMKINDNVLAACHKFGVQKVVSVLCSCIFPDKTTYPIEENMVQAGDSVMIGT